MARDRATRLQVPPAPKYASAKRWLKSGDDLTVVDVATALPASDASPPQLFGFLLALAGAIYLVARRVVGRGSRRGR